MRRHRPFCNDRVPDKVTAATALGLLPAGDDAILQWQEATLEAAARLWPIAAVALAMLPAGLVALAAEAGAPFRAAVLLGLPAAGAAAVAWVMLGTGVGRARVAHRRIGTLVLCSGAVAMTLSLHASQTDALPPPARLLALMAILGTMIVTAVALSTVRAASFSFAATLAAMVAVRDGVTPLALAGGGVATLLAAATLRAARRDHARTIERRRAGSASRLAEKLVATYEEHGAGWFWQTDRHGRLSYLSGKVARELSGLGIEPAGQLLTDVFRVDSKLVETERTLSFHLSSRTSFSDYSIRPAMDDAPDRWWSISGRPLLDDLGRYQGFIGSGSDLTEKRRAEAEITRLAMFDSLTGLANRQRMRLSLEQMLSGGGANSLFLLDLDRFKAVNDTLGHQVGDELLKQVALRLQRAVGDAGLVGRLGGDEFKVAIPREGSPERLANLAERVIHALSLPYYIDGSSISIGCSIGIAIAPLHGDTRDVLVRNADLALYAAKADGRGVHRFYREELLEGAQNRKRMEDDLRLALRHNQLHLAYQPVVSTRDGRIVGYEALLRWDHPTRGPISPADFVPVAEETGLIGSIGEWVLRTACAEAAGWPDHVRVAVNVSPIQFASPSLPTLVTHALASAGIAPGRLELEITEGVFLNEDASSEHMFRALKGLGVRLALDDFGTGYSSLGYLKKVPFDKIKIDQSFVRGAIMKGSRNGAIIKAIVTLADTLGMETTAEGVEQQDEIELIRQLGCSHIQGYVYGRAERAEAVAAQLCANDGIAVPIGHKTSREPRYRMLRSATLEVGTETGEVRIRNMSVSGAMIDGVDLPDAAVGHGVRIELLEGQFFAATIRWIGDGRAGLRFAAPFDLERLQPTPHQRTAA